MHPDELKHAWQALDRRLQRHDRLQLQRLLQHKLQRVRHSLRPLLWGQLLQSWWLLWVPVLMVLAALAGIDLQARAAGVVWIGLGVGVAGLAGSVWLYRCSRHPARPRLRRIVDDSLGGSSLRKASSLLDEVERFRND